LVLVCLFISLLGTGVVHGQSGGSIVGWGIQVVVEQSALDSLVTVAASHYHNLGLKSSSVTAVGEDGPGNLPGAAALTILSLTPNPFNPSMEVSFESQVPGNMTIEIYDVSGRLIRTVPLGYAGPGLHRARWDGRDASGHDVSSGVYFVRLRGTEGESRTVKAVFVR
jgi:hypothetical protein